MSGRVRTAGPLVVLVAAVLVAAYVTGTAPEGPPLDPRSVGPTGTRALVETLEALGADISLGDRPRPGDTAALLLTDTLDDAAREALPGWVRDGGVLVLTDPMSGLAPPTTGTVTADGFAAGPLDADCPLPAAVAAGSVRPSLTSATLDPPGDAVACFPGDDGPWLVAEPDGDGARVTLGGPDVLTNARLRDAGHAVLAVSLLAPDPPQARVTVIVPPRPGEGEATLTDLVPERVWYALAQLGVALLLLAAWRGRRLARPVAERQPVDLPASELVAATGGLLESARARGRAAALLRDGLRAELAERCGLPTTIPAERLADVLVARFGVAREDVTRALAAPEPSGDDDLVARARAGERLRRAVLRPHPTRGEHP